jgi:hypothetical protein
MSGLLGVAYSDIWMEGDQWGVEFLLLEILGSILHNEEQPDRLYSVYVEVNPTTAVVVLSIAKQ